MGNSTSGNIRSVVRDDDQSKAGRMIQIIINRNQKIVQQQILSFPSTFYSSGSDFFMFSTT